MRLIPSETWKPPRILQSRAGNFGSITLLPLPHDDWQPPGTLRQFHEYCVQALQAARIVLAERQEGARFSAVFVRSFVGCARLLSRTPASLSQPLALLHKPKGVRFAGQAWPSFHHAALWHCEQLLFDLERGLSTPDYPVSRRMPIGQLVTRVVDQQYDPKNLWLHEFPADRLRTRCVMEATWVPPAQGSPFDSQLTSNVAAPANSASAPSADSAAAPSKAGYHSAGEPVPERFAYGPLTGSQQELGFALDPRARMDDCNLKRRLDYAARSGQFWMVAVRRQQYEVYFERGQAFAEASQRLADFRARRTGQSKRIKLSQTRSRLAKN